MQERSFFKTFKGLLMLVIVATIGLTFQAVYTVLVKQNGMTSFLVLGFVAVFLSSLFRSLMDRDFPDWNVVKLDGQKVTAYNLFRRPLCTVDLSPGHTAYWAKVWVPKERGQAEPVLVLSNEGFTLPENVDQQFRTIFDRSRQMLIIGAPDHPSEWFPGAELVEVIQKDRANIML